MASRVRKTASRKKAATSESAVVRQLRAEIQDLHAEIATLRPRAITGLDLSVPGGLCRCSVCGGAGKLNPPIGGTDCPECAVCGGCGMLWYLNRRCPGKAPGHCYWCGGALSDHRSADEYGIGADISACRLAHSDREKWISAYVIIEASAEKLSTPGALPAVIVATDPHGDLFIRATEKPGSELKTLDLLRRAVQTVERGLPPAEKGTGS